MSEHQNCCCPACVAARRKMFYETHPIHMRNWKVVEGRAVR